MIDKAEIQFTLAMAEKGSRCELPAEVAAELCRVWLAWEGAPVAHFAPRPHKLDLGWSVIGNADNESQLDAMVGRSVRLVVGDD